MALFYVQAMSGGRSQFALSDNFKVWSNDVPRIIEDLLDEPHFEYFGAHTSSASSLLLTARC